MKQEVYNQLYDLTEHGYEDLTISENNLVDLFKSFSHNIPILINDKKIWIHISEHDYLKTKIQQ